MAKKTTGSKVSGRYEGANDCTLRLDVDGGYSKPRKIASGVCAGDRLGPWVADRLAPDGNGGFKGRIRWIDSNTTNAAFEDVRIEIRQVKNRNRAKVTLLPESDAAGPMDLKHVSDHFHSVELEVDAVEGVTPVVEIDTHAYDAPKMTRDRHLSIKKVFDAAGFDTLLKTNGGPIPADLAGPDRLWTDMELHDAMQDYWSRNASERQWAAWVLFTTRYFRNPDAMFGIMFDNIGEHHRQGVAIFNDSFLNWAPEQEGLPQAQAAARQEAFKKRARFVIACHEIAHTFDLPHPSQREFMRPWATVANDPEARTFMNYPRDVAGGHRAFYKDFRYRFADEEILYLRHAPDPMLQPGNITWLQDSDPQRDDPPSGPMRLDLRLNRTGPFEFMEPVQIEAKIRNVSSAARVCDRDILQDPCHFQVFIQREWGPIRQWRPFARPCCQARPAVLYPGESLISSLSVSTGLDGFYFAEPGRYRVRMVLQLDGKVVQSNWLLLEVSPEDSRWAGLAAQDFFSDPVARILYFGGSLSLENGNVILDRVAETNRRVALHARLALAAPLMRQQKRLECKNLTTRVNLAEADFDRALRLLELALHTSPAVAAETFGHVNYRNLAETFAAWLHCNGRQEGSVAVQARLYRTLSRRGVPPTHVVMRQIGQFGAELQQSPLVASEEIARRFPFGPVDREPAEATRQATLSPRSEAVTDASAGRRRQRGAGRRRRGTRPPASA